MSAPASVSVPLPVAVRLPFPPTAPLIVRLAVWLTTSNAPVALAASVKPRLVEALGPVYQTVAVLPLEPSVTGERPAPKGPLLPAALTPGSCRVPANTPSAPVKLLAVQESCKVPPPAFVSAELPPIGPLRTSVSADPSIPTVLSAAKVIDPGQVLLPCTFSRAPLPLPTPLRLSDALLDSVIPP